jgi:LmbE family N-acetylglucosaminyl deacetylase
MAIFLASSTQLLVTAARLKDLELVSAACDKDWSTKHSLIRMGNRVNVPIPSVPTGIITFDDEVLGCGALLSQMAAAGHTLFVVFATDGVGAGGEGDARTATRRAAANEAARRLGLEPPRWLGLPDQRLDALPRLDIIQAIEAQMAQLQPRLVLTHDPSDLNLDHRILFDAVSVAARPLPTRSCQALLTFETPSATDYGAIMGDAVFRPNLFIDASRGLDAKLAALGCYESELRDPPHPRSVERIRSLAQIRGAAAGLPVAEAFRIVYARGDIARFLPSGE